jgi:hypothetical protein
MFVLYFAVARSSELFVFRCGSEFRAICISLWLGVPSSFNFAVALFICLMSCWWLDSMFFIFSPVGARRDFCLFVECCVGGVPSYLYLALAWSSELFVFRCGLDFRAICISLWLGYPSPSFMVVARLNLYSSIVLLVLVGVQQRFRRYWNPVSLICGTQYSSISFSRFCWSPAEVS